ncbi:MAG: hypothetical protein KatS3mg126_1889 [Lysobacteraceae bacterium]|nr:MAG: hypothetical protein KatS3mg126_1889 [Xanthomonadaceae bacterium]
MNTLLTLTVLLALLAAGLGWRTWQLRRRHEALRRLLDHADALESLLHRARSRMRAMRQVVDRVAPDIGAEAHASLEADQPLQQGLRDVLEHRLWIARNADTASLRELREASQALQRSHRKIAQGLERLEGAGAELEAAARAAEAQEAREPASLRRSS